VRLGSHSGYPFYGILALKIKNYRPKSTGRFWV
jgi:hypothetical protein